MPLFLELFLFCPPPPGRGWGRGERRGSDPLPFEEREGSDPPSIWGVGPPLPFEEGRGGPTPPPPFGRGSDPLPPPPKKRGGSGTQNVPEKNFRRFAPKKCVGNEMYTNYFSALRTKAEEGRGNRTPFPSTPWGTWAGVHGVRTYPPSHLACPQPGLQKKSVGSLELQFFCFVAFGARTPIPPPRCFENDSLSISVSCLSGASLEVLRCGLLVVYLFEWFSFLLKWVGGAARSYEKTAEQFKVPPLLVAPENYKTNALALLGGYMPGGIGGGLAELKGGFLPPPDGRWSLPPRLPGDRKKNSSALSAM